MGDEWDYRLWKAQKVWDLAMRIIPSQPRDTGGWLVSILNVAVLGIDNHVIED